MKTHPRTSHTSTHTRMISCLSNGQFTTQTYCTGSLCHGGENYVGVERSHSIFYFFGMLSTVFNGEIWKAKHSDDIHIHGMALSACP